MTLHLRPTAPIARDALLPGDPGRALALAQLLMEAPRMSNHRRGLWGYWGETTEGRSLTIQSTGMGGPSAAIVLEELSELGVRRAIRVGTCGALHPALALGDLVIAGRALAEDGTSRALGADEWADADPELTAALERAAGSPGGAVPVASTDLFYEPRRDGHAAGAGVERWSRLGAAAVEMETAALFALGAALGVAVGCALVVSDVFEDGRRRRITDEELAAAVERMGRVAAEALATLKPS